MLEEGTYVEFDGKLCYVAELYDWDDSEELYRSVRLKFPDGTNESYDYCDVDGSTEMKPHKEYVPGQMVYVGDIDPPLEKGCITNVKSQYAAVRVGDRVKNIYWNQIRKAGINRNLPSWF